MFLYSVFNTVATCMVFLYNMLHYKQKKMILGDVSRSVIKYFMSKQRKGFNKILASVGFWTIIEIIVISAVQFYAVGYLNSAFGALVNTGANYYGLMFFAPWLVVLVCILWKIDPLAQLDLITPAYPFALIFTKIACYMGGCCRGIEWEGGYYNPTSRRIEFPAQLLESAVALLLFIFLLCFKKKFKKGTVFPIYLVAYSGIRFVTEFLRCEPAVFLGLKTYQILCIVGVLVGVLEYFIACKYNAHVQRTEKNPTILDHSVV